MKIVFLCGSLEQGRDGVGDYVLRFTAELIRQGHTAGALSLNDKYLSSTFSGNLSCEEIEIPVLRLPSVAEVNDRFKQAENWINEFNPDWLSLQFVPFSFHPKGLPFSLSNLLKGFGKFRKWHIMFHELWVGMDVNAPKKHVVLGWLQSLMIRSLIKKLNPKVIHTQTRLYQKQLDKIGFKSEYLPLFSNIPSFNHTNTSQPVTYKEDKSNKVSFVLFGSIHSNTPLEKFAEEFSLYAENTRGDIVIKFIGQCGVELDNWLNTLKSKNINFEVFGQQPPDQISNVLNTASFGISTTPIDLIEKSGSFAAMQEHGLPVICVSNPWYARGFENLPKSERVIEYIPGNLKSCLEQNKNGIKVNSISSVCTTFTKALNDY